MEIVFRILLFVVGACIGSFLCCQARRLHHNLTHKTKLKSKRSLCLHCKKPLKWYDNLPLISWLSLKGKCRHCHHKIGLAEFLSELTTAIAFPLLSLIIDPATATPLAWIIFIAILIFTSTLIFLAIYDGLYGELPTICLITAIIFAIIILALQTWLTLSATPFTSSLISNPLLSILILGGLYLLLYLISKGKWVGDGDWLLATAIAIVLAHPLLALITLFLSNFIACLITLPLAKGNYKTKIHFGPFLVTAFIITYSFSPFFITLML